MTTFIKLNNVTIDIPIFDVSRSFRTTMARKIIGGSIQKNATQPVSVRALEDITFSLKSGDRLGLIGHNGAGKTTLLRVLAGIYKPSKGQISTCGRISSLFNTSLGLDLDDTGLQNISTIGMYLGMQKNEIENKTDEIIEFSELGDFIHLPVRTYSSGMMARLSFGIATSLNPEILLLDEGIGAGDASFAEKAKQRLDQFYQRMDILVMASHSDALIKQLCTKAILLEHGHIVSYGETSEIIDEYHERIKQQEELSQACQPE